MPSGRRTYRIKLADALNAHDLALREGGGGLPGIRHLDSIEAAIARPYSGYHRGIARKAAVLVQSISGGHGFVDGNKRTAVILMHLLTRRSGYELTALVTDNPLDQAVEDLVVDLECHRLTLEQAIEWFERRLRRIHE